MWTRLMNTDRAEELTHALLAKGDRRYYVRFEGAGAAYFWTYSGADAKGVAEALSQDQAGGRPVAYLGQSGRQWMRVGDFYRG